MPDDFTVKVTNTPDEQAQGIVHASIGIPMCWVARRYSGWDAGQLRAIGLPIEESIPDQGVLQRDGSFEWINLEFTLKDDVTEEPS